MIKTFLLVVCGTMLQYSLPAQTKLLAENYYYNKSGFGSNIPMLAIETRKKWYAQVRYNYEEEGTLSVFAGKTVSGGETLQYTFTPLLGYSFGNFKGPSLGFDAEVEWKNFFVSSQSQYSMYIPAKDKNFFFTWSEAGYNISDRFYVGPAVQFTHTKCEDSWEPGFLAGLNFKNLSFPLYLFKPFQHERYFIIGLNYEFTLKSKHPKPL